jgi:uncharacterized protein
MEDALYDKTIPCAYCNTSFHTKRVKISRIKAVKRDSDFCTYFAGDNPMYYEYNICPHCGFAFTDSFSPVRGLKRAQLKEQYLDKIVVPDACGLRNLEDAIKGYKLSLLCASIVDEKTFIKANICLRIAWFNRYKGDLTEENRFMQHAAEMYEQIYQTESLDQVPMEEPKLLYLIAELHARLGHYNLTRSWFSYLLMAEQIDAKWKSMARDRWFEIKTRHANAATVDDPEGYDHYRK